MRHSKLSLILAEKKMRRGAILSGVEISSDRGCGRGPLTKIAHVSGGFPDFTRRLRRSRCAPGQASRLT